MRKPAFNRLAADALDAVADRYFRTLDEIRALQCPQCESYGAFQVYVKFRHQRWICNAPIPRADPEDTGYCGYEAVYHATSVAEIAEPRFILVEPTPPSTRAKRAIR